MKGLACITGLVLAGGFAATTMAAGEFGTPEEARAMLAKAATEVKKDKAAALDKFNKGADGFKDRDLYPFCMDLDGMTTAHPTHKGKNIKELKDKKGKAFGEEIMRVAQDAQFRQVSYMWPKPGQTEPSQKMSYVTKVGDQVCGVGYYKP